MAIEEVGVAVAEFVGGEGGIPVVGQVVGGEAVTERIVRPRVGVGVRAQLPESRAEVHGAYGGFVKAAVAVEPRGQIGGNGNIAVASCLGYSTGDVYFRWPTFAPCQAVEFRGTDAGEKTNGKVRDTVRIAGFGSAEQGFGLVHGEYARLRIIYMDSGDGGDRVCLAVAGEHRESEEIMEHGAIVVSGATVEATGVEPSAQFVGCDGCHWPRAQGSLQQT